MNVEARNSGVDGALEPDRLPAEPDSSQENGPPESLWTKAYFKFRRDRAGVISLAVVLVYFVVALGVWLGIWATAWDEVTGSKWLGITADHWFGTNLIGQDIYDRAVYSTATAFEVGLVVAVLSTVIGALLGAFAGFFSGKWLDEVVVWLMGVLDSIPFYLLVAAIAFALTGNPYAMHIAMVSTFWITTARLVRGEVIKLKNFEFVEAAHAIGVAEPVIIVRHIIPNTFHILLVQATITFVAAIKSEVILSFLGLGVQDGMSWGLMIAESTQEVLAGFFNNFIAASALMFGLVMAFNMFSDALQDALDPRKVS
jgi:ABC-type dipeptide/oligopeptide/nickel transport system permease subunit